eukprot:121472-Amphidinium_carterae.1
MATRFMTPHPLHSNSILLAAQWLWIMTQMLIDTDSSTMFKERLLRDTYNGLFLSLALESTSIIAQELQHMSEAKQVHPRLSTNVHSMIQLPE